MARLTREESKARTRARLMEEARRLFRERGYAATSLEQIAESAEVTKGAIYGHFDSKEELFVSMVELTPTPDLSPLLADGSRPIPDRLAEFGRAVALDPASNEPSDLAITLEFVAALLRNPGALQRYGDDFRRRITELEGDDNDDDQPREGVTPLEVWAIGQALFVGLHQYRFILPDVLTPDAFARAFGLLAGLFAPS
ncbi:MAG: TetR family transcriptional regulator [Acidimicrobiales bacterium]